MKLEEQPTSIAQHLAHLVSSPERRGLGLTVLAGWGCDALLCGDGAVGLGCCSGLSIWLAHFERGQILGVLQRGDGRSHRHDVVDNTLVSLYCGGGGRGHLRLSEHRLLDNLFHDKE